MSYSAVAKKRILVIGYGVGGSQFTGEAAKNKNYQITVLTPFDYQEVPVNMTKAIAVGGEEHAKVIFPLLREEGVDYIIDSCASIRSGSATTTSGRVIDFDVCVIATGQKIPIFFPSLQDNTREKRIQSIAAITDSIKRANHIVISGAGPVGSELAADIKLRARGKKVTLISPHEGALSMMNQPFPELASTFLKNSGIDIISNDRVERHADGEILLASGKTIRCDLYIPAFASGGNATFLPNASQDAKGYAMVDDTFKVAGLTNVFALGDCSNYDKIKTFPKIGDQMPVLQFNVKATLEGTQLKHHIKGASMPGRFTGPGFVALGHGLDEGYGVGPDCPGFCGFFCWACCFCGAPCSAPAGHGVAKFKSDFNYKIKPQIGKGISM